MVSSSLYTYVSYPLHVLSSLPLVEYFIGEFIATGSLGGIVSIWSLDKGESVRYAPIICVYYKYCCYLYEINTYQLAVILKIFILF